MGLPQRVRSASVVIVLAVAALVGTAPVTSAAFPGENGRIAIGAHGWLRPDASAIWTLAPDGTSFRLLKHGRGLMLGEWLADGRRLLVFDGPGSPAIMTAGSPSLRHVPLGEYTNGASVSPDGRYLVYGRPSPSSDMSALAEIWRAGTDGSANRRLGEGYNPRWSPDGRYIAFLGADGLSVMSARTGRVLRVLVPGMRSAGSLDWSPDGRRLVYSAFWPDRGIYAIRADGRGAARLIVPEPSRRSGHHFSAVWSPDGSRIAFARSVTLDEEVAYTVWTVGARGGRPHRIYASGLIDAELSSDPTISWQPIPVGRQ